jgi:hypothetical protein
MSTSDRLDQPTRALAYEQAMERVGGGLAPADDEASIFYAQLQQGLRSPRRHASAPISPIPPTRPMRNS